MALWTPSDLAAGLLKHWYDINDASSLTDVGSGVISVINDKSGGSRHLSQSTSGKRGTRTAANTNFHSKPTLAVPSAGGYPGSVAHAIPDAVQMLMDGGTLNGGVTGGTSSSIGTAPLNALLGLHWQPGSSHGASGNDSVLYWKNGVALSVGYAGDTTNTFTTGGATFWIGRIKSDGQGNSVGRFFSSETTNGTWFNRSTDYARTADVDMAE